MVQTRHRVMMRVMRSRVVMKGVEKFLDLEYVLS